MFQLATGHLGLSYKDYYAMTPKELYLMAEGYAEQYKRNVEMMAAAVKVGMVNANRGKSYKVFSKDNNGTQHVGADVTRAEWKELKAKFAS